MSKGKHRAQNSRVGRGMKPRGSAEETKVETMQEEKPLSTDQVQAEGTEQGENKAPEGEQTPPSQEQEKPDLVKMLLESANHGRERDEERVSRAIYGTGKAEETPNVKPTPDPEMVLEAIKKDEQERHGQAMASDPSHTPIKPGELHQGQRTPDEDLAAKGLAVRLERVPLANASTGKDAANAIKPPEVDRVEFYQRVGDEYVKIPGPVDVLPPLYQLDAETGVVRIVDGAGKRPNGDLGVVITIPEYFVTSVKDFAEADGHKSVEQWCSEFFNMNLEAYCQPSKGR